MRSEFSDDAKAELRHARERYDAEREGLGRELLLELREIVRLIRQGPLHFEKLPRSKARRALGTRFPYQLVSLVLPDRIRIIAVAHQKQRSRYWRGRA